MVETIASENEELAKSKTVSGGNEQKRIGSVCLANCVGNFGQTLMPVAGDASATD
jgi:hypothetical protein